MTATTTVDDLRAWLIERRQTAVRDCTPSTSSSDLDWLSGRIALLDELSAWLPSHATDDRGHLELARQTLPN